MTTLDNSKEVKLKKPLGHMIWFKVLLTTIVFIPPYTQMLYDPSHTPDVIAIVMEKPLVLSIAWVLPLVKMFFLVVIVLPFIFDKFPHRFLLGYYVLILLNISIMQNMSFTEKYGFVWLIGNTLVQWVVLLFCLVDILKGKTLIKKENFVASRLWIVLLMLLAFLMPYSVKEGSVYPSLTYDVFFNESGVTYCMITPIVIGILLLYSKGVHKPTLSVISYVGFVFGLLNMMTWFVFQIENWWMGVLHLPLVILSFYGLLISYKEKILVKVRID